MTAAAFGPAFDPALIAAALAAAAVGVPAAVAKQRHRRRLHRFGTRVNVNGHRGKTTVTRLITGALAGSGATVAGKTTGTVPRLMLAPDWTEFEMARRPDSPNISEQLSATRFATLAGAEVIVAECMAVSPDYQRVFAHEMTRAGIGVVTNVLNDHLDVMGPTVTEAAEVMATTVPRGGTCVTIDGPHVAALERRARKLGATVVIADPATVDVTLLDGFGYLVLAEHVAITLEVARAAGVSDDDALAGMLAARPDPYATRIVPVLADERIVAEGVRFVAGFSVNDPDSTLRLWDTLTRTGHRAADPTVLMSCRADRRDRTVQFVNQVLPHLHAAEIIVIGDGGAPVVDGHRAGRFGAASLHDLTGTSARQIAARLRQVAAERPGSTVYGIGNVKGQAMQLSDLLRASDTTPPAGVWPQDRGAVIAHRLRRHDLRSQPQDLQVTARTTQPDDGPTRDADGRTLEGGTTYGRL